MHSLLDLTCIYPSPVATGEGRAVQALDRTLARCGLDVSVVVLRPWAPAWMARRMSAYRHLAPREGRVQDEGVRVFNSRYLRIPKLPERYRLPANIELMARRAGGECSRWKLHCDVIHAQGVTAGLAAVGLSPRLHRPYAVTLHDDLAHLEKLGTVGTYYRRMFLDASAIFAISPTQIRRAADYLPAEALPRLVVAPFGIDVAGIRALLPSTTAAKAEFSGRIISVSSLYRWKGIHENLQAMQALLQRGITAWRYTVVGDGPYHDVLVQLASALGLGDRVEFAGALPHAEAIRRMHDSDIFCLPSWMESYGQVFAEAAVCGVPAIGCRDNGPESIIQQGRTGLLVPPRDVGALTDALAQLLTSPERAFEMGRTASSESDNLGWERAAAIYMREFARITGGGQ